MIRGTGEEDGEEPAAIPLDPEKKRLSGRFNLRLGMQPGSNWPAIEVTSEDDGMAYAFRLAIIICAIALFGGAIFTLLYMS